MRWKARQKRIAFEVVQTSAMDCGPAALKCLLEGFGIPISYGRLREACQTSVDGTSIDVIEEVARDLGLLAEQVVLPTDHLFLSCAQNLPALMITLLPSGATHFTVAWSDHGPLIQLMDPAQGRRLITKQALIDQLYVHEMHVLASDWEEWARTPEFTDALLERLTRTLSSTRLATRLLTEALDSPNHRALARLDAATRFVATLPRQELGVMARGALLTSLLNLSQDEARAMIPASCWSALPLDGEDQEEQAPMIRLRGAVGVRVKGVSSQVSLQDSVGGDERRASLSRSLQGHDPSTLRWMLSLCWTHARRNLFLLAICGAILSLGGILEALLMQELFVAGRELTTTMTRLGAAAAFLFMALILWGAQLLHHLLARQAGRHLEQRLRIMLHERLPWLKPQYFSSRLHSDMIERAHALSATRQIAHFIAGVWQALLTMVGAALGLWWLARDLGGVILGCLVALTILPLVVQPFLRERELRARVHAAARGQVVLDALLGSVPARAHGAQEDLRVAHEGRLVSWVRAQRAQVSAQALVRALQAALIATSSAALVWNWWYTYGELAGALLLVYWAQRMGDGAYHLAMRLFDYPTLSNVMARQHELIHGEEEPETRQRKGGGEEQKGAGMSLLMRDCGARQAGHEVLRGINAEVKPGQHIAIVGASGAGKSTLLNLIMGLVEDIQGTIELDGRPPSLWMASEEIAWIDAANHLWKDSILENVCYGLGGTSHTPSSSNSPGEAMEQAELMEVLARTTSGMRSSVGEQGGLLSGGEGQRVRIARALMTWERARLIILDEALRGLERARRERLLDHLRRRARQKTMLVVTHDLSMTRRFDEVWVLSHGELVERGSPSQLIAQETSHYRRLLDAEERLHQRTWGAEAWRVAVLEEGKLRAQSGPGEWLINQEDEPHQEEPAKELVEAPSGDERPPGMFAPDALDKLFEQLLARCATPHTPAAPRLSPARQPPSVRSSEEVTRWLGDQGAVCGLEIRPMQERCDRVDAMLLGGLPLILGCRDEHGELFGFRVAMRRRGKRVELLLPEGGSLWVRASSLREALTGRVTQHEQRMQQTLQELGTSPLLAAKLSKSFVRLRKNAQHSPTHWHVQACEEQGRATMWSSIARDARAGRWFMAMVVVGLLGYAMMSLGWWLLGRGSLMGEGSVELLLAWSGALGVGALCVGMEVWVGGEMALRLWRSVLMRVMDGALAMPDLKRRGVGELMGQLYEAEGAVEALLDGSVMALMGMLALLFASWVMWQGEGGARLIVAMILFGACVLVASTRWMRLLRQWTSARVGLTGVLVDRMLGHTTRQLQRPRVRWYEGEEERLLTYLERSKRLDDRSAWLHGWMSRGWYALAWVVLAPTWIKGDGVSLAVSWGGVLLAAQGFANLSGSMEALGRGWVAHGELGRFLSAAKREATPGAQALVSSSSREEVRRGEVVLRGHGMVVRAGERISPVLSECEVVIRQGEQWLIKGGSGAGKSTLASVLGGERALDAGVVVSRGGDVKVLGERLWRREVMVVPQFHENHIFRGTLAMNVLLGQGWPAEPEALARCEEVLHALGMGEVLARMPGGLNQMVGESGWSLSHGEKNRIYIARALLGRARVVIFDESFSALDPETAERVLTLVKERLSTIVVIAHP